MSKVATNLLGAGIIALIALGVGFIATHHTVKTNCHYSADADATMCGFKYEGN
jgi:hypothetical protein